MEENIEDNIEPKDDKDTFKKDLEIQKLQKEIKKLDLESTELKWRKFSAWGPTAVALITIGVSIYITFKTQLFQAITERLKIESLSTKIEKDILDARKDALSISIRELREDSIQRVKELKDIKNEISNLSSNFKKTEVKYKKLLIKREYLIKKLGVMTDSLGKEIVKAEDCYSKAKELLMICVRGVYEYESSKYEFMQPYERRRYPLKTRFRKSDSEIAEMELSKINSIQFLIEIAYFELKNEFSPDKKLLLNTNLVSNDGVISFAISTMMSGNIRKANINNANYKRDAQFECWKSLSKNQKLKLLKEIRIRE